MASAVALHAGRPKPVGFRSKSLRETGIEEPTHSAGRGGLVGTRPSFPAGRNVI